jgi:hybrid cluster-associated redox disulfide protein
MAKKKITKNTLFSEVIEQHPEAAGVLLESGMHCVGCPMSTGETVEQGALMHGLDPDKLVKEMNKRIEKQAFKKTLTKTKKKK